MQPALIQLTKRGLFCEAGGFYIDPWKAVDCAIITHAHADHARWGSHRYLAAAPGAAVLRSRLGDKAHLEFAPFGQVVDIKGVKVSFHPAGHILGSAQVKLERNGYSVVVSGDYKRQHDPTCAPFQPVRCNLFITESTFGLPIYRWPATSWVMDEINQWWRNNQQAGKASVLLAYSLGKAQRLLAGVDASIGPIVTHGAVEKINEAYRATNVALPATTHVSKLDAKATDWTKALVVAPPAVAGSSWLRRLGRYSLGMASGWMQIRGTRRRRALDRGFILSDHVDWQALMDTIRETEADECWVTHGYSDIVARHLRENGLNAKSIETRFEGELLDSESESADSSEAASDD